MKNLLFSLFLIAIITGQVSSQTISVHVSGTVTRETSGTPVSNHQVTIRADGNPYGFIYNATRITNPNGFWDCTINDVPATGAAITFIVATINCDSSEMHSTFIGSTTPSTVNFVLCNGSAACEAEFTFHVDNYVHLGLVDFTDLSSPSGQIASWYWDFGVPGAVSTAQNPWYEYSSPGTYHVCLTIATTTGCTSMRCHEVTYTGTAACESWITYAADFLTVHFEGHTHSQFPTDYTWTMGDSTGTTMTGITPVFTYPAAGTYIVALHTIDSTGCEYYATKEITLHATCDLHGTIYAGSTPADFGTVELYKSDDGTITLVNSVNLSDSSGVYWFGGVYPGHYYLKASLLQNSVHYGHYIPTYYTHSAGWNEATLIELGQPSNPYNIELIPALNYSNGPGTIGGMITQGAKVSGEGTPVPNVEVLLQDPAGQPLACTLSDTEGKFSFTDVSFGDYRIYPEITGKTTTPANVTINTTVPAVTSSFTIQGNNILGIRDNHGGLVYNVSEICPNPVSDKAVLTITGVQETSVSLSVYHVTGQLATEITFRIQRGANEIRLPVDELSAGIYYISVKYTEGNGVIRKMIIRK